MHILSLYPDSKLFENKGLVLLSFKKIFIYFGSTGSSLLHADFL